MLPTLTYTWVDEYSTQPNVLGFVEGELRRARNTIRAILGRYLAGALECFRGIHYYYSDA